MNKLYLSLVIMACFCLTEPIKAQREVVTAGQYLRKAETVFAQRNYNRALEYYDIVLKDNPDPDDKSIIWNAAESARLTHHYVIAENYYTLLAKSDAAKNFPKLKLHWARVRKSLGNYDGAIQLLQAYAGSAAVASIASEEKDEAQAEIDACEWAKNIIAQPEKYKLTSAGEKVNTPYTDLAPRQHDGVLYYATAFFPKKEDAKPVLHIFSNDMKRESTDLPINAAAEGISTTHYALNTEGVRVYFNQCTQKENGEFHCEIFYREKGGDGNWKDAIRLPDTINTKEFSASQPAIGLDKSTGREVLYFVSDRKGGKGGMDIWYSDISADGKFGIPQNLSTVNTKKDEITPYFLKDNQYLFFSSDGYKSLGGLDIFYVQKSADGSWSTPTHGGYPLNSSYDDSYYSLENGRIYTVSNRKGGICNSVEKDCICNDIYFQDIEADLKALTLYAADGSALTGCKVELYNAETGELVFMKENSSGNDFAFPLQLNRQYKLVASRPGYSSDFVTFNTLGLIETTTIEKTLKLNPALKLTVYVKDAIDLTPIDGARIEIREAATNKLVATEILRGNVFTTDKIEFGKSYRLFGFKESYEADTNNLLAILDRSENKFEYVDTLLLTPFSGLPLVLYFDNDHPNPNNRDSITMLTYGQTYNAYYAKLPDYLRGYFRSNRTVSASGSNDITNFFNNDIKANYEKLNIFTALLKKYLAAGKRIQVEIEGFASPLAKNDYNLKLTGRRTSSLKNHFFTADNGALRQYIAAGQLVVTVAPYGEEKSDKAVSDDEKQPSLSIYSVGAMRERKVQINKITVLSNDGKILFGDAFERDYLKSLGGNAEDIFRLATAANGGRRSGLLSYSGSSRANGIKSGAKKRVEVVLVDVYTNEIIKKRTDLQVVESSNAQVKTKKKGYAYGFDLAVGNSYVLKGAAPGYSKAEIAITDFYTEGVDVIRDTLFLAPFAGIPTTLYFANDNPDPNTTRATTRTSYEKSYRSFYDLKGKYVQKFTRFLTLNGAVPQVDNEMTRFFEMDVKGGYEKLLGVTSIFEQYLSNGYAIEVVLEGHASPLANTAYNESLSNRRVNSVINYINSYGGGDLRKYLKNKQLSVSLVPMGENQAPTTVSDDSKNPLSIYSLEASRERRVIIKDIIIKKL